MKVEVAEARTAQQQAKEAAVAVLEAKLQERLAEVEQQAREVEKAKEAAEETARELAELQQQLNEASEEVKEEVREILASAGTKFEELNRRQSDLIGREDRLHLRDRNNLLRSRELSAQERDIKAREKDLARREDQTKAAGPYVSRVNDGRTYWRDYNPRLDKSSKDYWKDYVTGKIAGNQAAIKDSELIKNTIVPAAAIGSVGVFIATAATGLTFMLSIAAALLAIAIFVFKDCQDEITNGKDNIKELSNNKNRSTNYLADKGASGSLRLQ